MKENSLYCLIMAGGVGSRFWPLSTPKRPKQYLSLVSENSLLQESLQRPMALTQKEHCFLVTSQSQEKIATEQVKDLIGPEQIIFEPQGRNTAPCIFLSLLTLIERGAQGDDVLAALPADHFIKQTKNFQNDLDLAAQKAREHDVIVTLGIPPHCPHTGYGYIHKGDLLSGKCHRVAKFCEKPPKEQAEIFYQSGDYLWNGGIFVAKISRLLNEFETHATELFEKKDELLQKIHQKEDLTDLYLSLPAQSIDYQVIEKSKHVGVIEASFDWSDLGSWDALEGKSPEVKKNTLILPPSKTHIEEASGCIVYTKKKNLVMSGVKDLIIVETEDSLMVIPKDQAQRVKEIAQKMSD